MRKTKILLTLLLIVFLISSYCFATDTVGIAEESTENQVTLDSANTAPISANEVTNEATNPNSANESELTNHDVYLCEEHVNLNGLVDGNAFIIAKEATISGEIGGDLFIMAEKINIEGGYIYSNVFALGKEINVNGIVYDLYAACDSFNLKSSGFIYRDMRVVASNVSLAGKIRRDAHIVSKDLSFDTTVGTIIYGDLDYSSDEAEFTAPEGSVQAKVKYTAEIKDTSEKVSFTSKILNYVFDLLQTLAITLVVTLLLLWLTPKFIDRVGNMSVGKSFASLGIGIVIPILLIILGIILLIIGIGTQIFFAGLFGYLLLSFIGFAVTSIFFAKLIAKIEGKFKFVLFTILIALVLWFVDQIPFIQGLAGFLAWAFGTGTILLNIVSKKDKDIKEN